MRSRSDLLLHPAALVAIAAMVVNDHVLKVRWPSWVTGKLSDAAGLAFFPLLVLVAFATLAPRTTKRRPHDALAAAIVLTAIVFTLVKTLPVATHAYAIALGALQWPFHAASAVLQHAELPVFERVVAVTDPTDLLALPFALVPLFIATRSRLRDRVSRLERARA